MHVSLPTICRNLVKASGGKLCSCVRVVWKVGAEEDGAKKASEFTGLYPSLVTCHLRPPTTWNLATPQLQQWQLADLRSNHTMLN